MDKELVELHELYNKHDPVWIASLLGPIGIAGKQLVVAVGLCPCGMGVFSSLTAYKPEENNKTDKDWKWERAPLETVLEVEGAWKGGFEKLMRCNAKLADAQRTYVEHRKKAEEAKLHAH